MKATAKSSAEGGNNLIAYFSRPGSNYAGGGIVDLTVGNTEVLAKIIREEAGGRLFHIQPEKAYPDDYTKCTDVAKEELRGNARPRIVGHVENVASYDLIFLGYPNWWGTMPMAVLTFLESFNSAGKTIAPFCTHEGSGMGRSEQDLRKHCPQAKVLPGLAVRGGDVQEARGAVVEWLREAR